MLGVASPSHHLDVLIHRMRQLPMPTHRFVPSADIDRLTERYSTFDDVDDVVTTPFTFDVTVEPSQIDVDVVDSRLISLDVGDSDRCDWW